jgi:hypothetical protein
MKRSELQPGMEVAVRLSSHIEQARVVDPKPIDIDYMDHILHHKQHGQPWEVTDHPNRYCTVEVKRWPDDKQVWEPRHVLLNHVTMTWTRHLAFEELRKASEAIKLEEAHKARSERVLRRKLMASMAEDAGIRVTTNEEGSVWFDSIPIHPWQEEGRVSERVLFRVLKMLAEAQEELRKANGEVFIPRA